MVTGHGQVVAAESLGAPAVFALVTAGIAGAAWIGRVAHRRHAERVGLSAIAASVRGEHGDPSLTGTAMRTGATWMASASLASIGREAAIMETGGMFGVVVGRVAKRPGHRLAVAGIAAAFAVAYHAPLAAVLYVEEHLGVRHDRRTVAHAVAGSAIGIVFARWLFGSEAIFPAAVEPLSVATFGLALMVLVPAYAASLLFRAARERLSAASDRARRPWVWALGLAAVVGAVVALVPMTAGNGMEALRTSATTTTASVALALLLGKLVATSAAIGSGAPGGVVSPSLAVAGGAALTWILVLDALGVQLAGARWDAVLVAMSVGVAVSIRSPMVAVLMVPEMSGDLRLVPVTAVVVSVVVLLDQLVVRRRRSGLSGGLHDEDA